MKDSVKTLYSLGAYSIYTVVINTL